MQKTEVKRRHIRFSCEGDAEIALGEAAAPLTGTILDLSREGCLVLLKDDDSPVLAASTKVNVTFALNRQRFQLAGVVRSQRQDGRIGIRFDSVDSKMGSQLATLTASQTKGWAARSRLEPMPLQPERAPVIGGQEPTAVQTDS